MITFNLLTVLQVAADTEKVLMSSSGKLVILQTAAVNELRRFANDCNWRVYKEANFKSFKQILTSAALGV
jgi:hypothetical protein